MIVKKKTLLSWSSGKDSAWTLHCIKQDPNIEIAGLFTVYNKKYDRASMHATRLTLLEKQAEAAGLPIELISLPDKCSMEQCNQVMAEFILKAESDGIEHIAFGDLFLEDIRQYREDQLREASIQPIFPLWNIPTSQLAQDMLEAGVEAFVSSVDLSKLPAEIVGRKWDRTLLEEVPAECDPCGENGEMHTIVTGGPMFTNTIPATVGERVIRNGFAYVDILPY